jgi:hypothetical protein
MLGITTTNARVGGFRGKGIDADATAFFARVTAAGGTLSATERTAINKLVKDMKSANVWNSMKAVYPMVGASAAACAQNLKSSSFTGTFNGGWTYASTGVTPNGTNAFMNTGLIPSADFSATSNSTSIYIRTESINAGCQVGTQSVAGASTRNWLFVRYDATNYHEIRNNFSTIVTVTTPATSQGFWVNNRPNINNIKLMRNGSTLISSAVPSISFSTQSIYLGAVNSSGTATEFTNRQSAFLSIGDGLSDTNASDFYTAVQAFQTTLSRQI